MTASAATAIIPREAAFPGWGTWTAEATLRSRFRSPWMRNVEPGISRRRREERVRDPSDSEDIRNVEKFLAGDARAFEELFDKYREKVYSVAYRFVRDKEDALEVTQDVFLRVYLSLKQFKTQSRFFTWLYRIAVNRAIDLTRSRKTQPLVGVDPSTLEQQVTASRRPPAANPLERAQERELEEYLERAVDTLSSKHRAVFVLHASENLSYKQIATVLDCSIGTVMSRLFYARRKLQEILRGFGVDLLGEESPRSGRRTER